MMIIMVLSFALAWLPLSIENTTRDFDLDIIPEKHFSLIFTVFHCNENRYMESYNLWMV